MTQKTLNSSRHALIESCTHHLQIWKPFQPKTLDLDHSSASSFHNKKPCLADRGASASSTAAAAAASHEDLLDHLSKLNLFDHHLHPKRGEGYQWIARKRRRQGSRSVSGRSSDRSRTGRCRSIGGGGGASAAYATCSDFPIAAGGTDSSGEMFVNGGGDGNWGSDVSEARSTRRDGNVDGVAMEASSVGGWQHHQQAVESQGNESGYGSEPGYRGDAEFGYGDEFDEEEEDGRVLFWGGGGGFGGSEGLEMVAENTFAEQKSHHRCRRKKHDWRIIAS
ncbi:hypothetical protein QJS04_geneDACA019735 [Acorus gramineus]|uniref:Uncharacterized protein n=1 Tax=Acorus gramineus TaxID=55184 RepID=A0AAV9BUZ1_ACOGR|nr:hypothetical protein QJS04_geneDACA019735 [Acorus gramineus]